LWRAIYLFKMPGLNRKVRVAMDWTIRLLFAPDLAQLKMTAGPEIRGQHFEAGDAVFHQGELGDSVYVIRRGEVEVLRGEQVVAALGPGDYFGEMALLSDKTRNATVRVRTSLEVVLIAKEDFALLGATLPAFAAEFRGKAESRGAAATETPPPQA
jgi:NADH dehydrogenase